MTPKVFVDVLLEPIKVVFDHSLDVSENFVTFTFFTLCVLGVFSFIKYYFK